jgi:hypothetical protein
MEHDLSLHPDLFEGMIRLEGIAPIALQSIE